MSFWPARWEEQEHLCRTQEKSPELIHPERTQLYCLAPAVHQRRGPLHSFKITRRFSSCASCVLFCASCVLFPVRLFVQF